MKKNCLICNKEFIKLSYCSRKNWAKAKYCSWECRAKGVGELRKGIGNKIIKNCETCLKQFQVYPYRKDEAKFCSRKCRGIQMLDFFKDKKNHYNWKGGISSAPNYHNFYSKQHKLRKKGALGTHTLEEWEALKKFYGYMCLCCKLSEPNIILTQDHVIPLAKGGNNTIDNIQPLCASCNARKYIHITDFRSLNKNIYLLESLN